MTEDDRMKWRHKCHSALADNRGLVLVSATEVLKLLDVDADADDERDELRAAVAAAESRLQSAERAWALVQQADVDHAKCCGYWRKWNFGAPEAECESACTCGLSALRAALEPKP